MDEEGQDQQPEAPLNASCKLLHSSHSFTVRLPPSSLHQQQQLQMKRPASPDVVHLTGTSPTTTTTPVQTPDESCERREALLPALLLCGLLQRALRSGRSLEPLRGDGSLVRHALPHHVPFPPQCDFLQGKKNLA